MAIKSTRLSTDIIADEYDPVTKTYPITDEMELFSIPRLTEEQLIDFIRKAMATHSLFKITIKGHRRFERRTKFKQPAGTTYPTTMEMEFETIPDKV